MVQTGGVFQGYRVLVTGGSRGIGAAVVAALAERGARVAVHGSGRGAAPSLVGVPGGPHLAVAGDVADPAAVQRFVGEAVEGLGGLDVLVDNAGVFDRLDPRTATYAQWIACCNRMPVRCVPPARRVRPC